MSPTRLTEASLHAARSGTILPTYNRDATRIGMVHIGPGAFHRAHQAYYVDTLLHSDKRWAISALSLKSTGLRDALKDQQGLYTLVELGAAPRARVIGSIRELLVGSTDSAAAFARLASRETRLVSLTVTEKGYCLDAKNLLDLANADIAHDLANPAQPRSTIGWIVEALARRRAQGVPPFTVLSCDNLPENGSVLHRALVTFAAARDADLARWLESEVVCPRTMVDSITPATDDPLRKRTLELTGLIDEWPIQREPFTQWVIEDLPAMRDADWQSVGVTLAKDVGVYDRAKLRLVNGPHSTLTYIGLLRGHESVADAMRDEQLAQFVELLMTEDLASEPRQSAGLRPRTLHLRRARALPQSRHPALAQPDRLGWLEEAPRAHRRDHRGSTARRTAGASAGHAARRVDALHRPPVEGRRAHRRSGCRATRVDRRGVQR